MATVGNGHVRIERDDGRADVVIDRPDKRNALNEAVVADLTEAMGRVDDDDSVRAVALLGEGSVFCAGFELEVMYEKTTDEQEGFQEAFAELLDTMGGATTPIVAGIKGAGIAAGFEVTLPADLRVLGADAKYGIPEVNLGIFPHQGSTQRLPRLVGLAKAKELVLTGEYVDPEEAKRCNLATEVVPDGEVDERTRALADDLTEKAPLGIERALEAFEATFDVPLEDGLRTERRLALPLYDTRDKEEGFAARLDRREPEFEGR